MIISFTLALTMLKKDTKRSWVMGRFGTIFSKARAMACASKPPIRMGILLLPLTSFKSSTYEPDCVWLYSIPLISNRILPMNMLGISAEFLHRFNKFWYNFKSISDNTVVGRFEERCFGVWVNDNNDF